MMTRQEKKKTEVSKAEKKRAEAAQKRADNLFKRQNNVIGPNDMVTNVMLKKVKLESDASPSIVVKTENVSSDNGSSVEAEAEIIYRPVLSFPRVERDEEEITASLDADCSKQTVQETSEMESTEVLKLRIEKLSAEIRDLREGQDKLKNTVVEQAMEITDLKKERDTLKNTVDMQLTEIRALKQPIHGTEPEASSSQRHQSNRKDNGGIIYETQGQGASPGCHTERNSEAVLYTGRFGSESSGPFSVSEMDTVDLDLDDDASEIDTDYETCLDDVHFEVTVVEQTCEQEDYTFSHETELKTFAFGKHDNTINPFNGRPVKFMVTRDTLRMEDEISSEKINLTPPKSTNDFQSHLEYFNSYKKYCSLMQPKSLQFWFEVSEFLAKFGRHVQNLTVFQQDCGLTPVCLLEILSLCLQHTPRLETLNVYGSFCQILQEPKQEFPPTGYVSYPGMRRRTRSCSDSQPEKVLWWHPLLCKRLREAERFIEVHPLPKLPNLKTIVLRLKEYLPEYKDYKESTQGFSICNYVFLQNKEIMSSKIWSNFSALSKVHLYFAKTCVTHNGGNECRNEHRYLPFVRTWQSKGVGHFITVDLTQMVNPISSLANSPEFVCAGDKPVETDRRCMEENRFLYIPPNYPSTSANSLSSNNVNM